MIIIMNNAYISILLISPGEHTSSEEELDFPGFCTTKKKLGEISSSSSKKV